MHQPPFTEKQLRCREVTRLARRKYSSLVPHAVCSLQYHPAFESVNRIYIYISTFNVQYLILDAIV